MKLVRTFALLAAVATALAPFAAAQAPDTTPPTLVRGEIDGTTMTLYFSETLDTTSVPAARAFWAQVNFPCSSCRPGWICRCGSTCWSKGPVVISGTKVMVGGVRRATPGHRAWFYRYRSSRAVNKLRDVAGNEVRDIPPMIELSNVSTPAVRLVEVSGTVVTMTFYTQLDTSSKPAASAFAVTVGGSAATLATTDPVEISGDTLKLNLASAAASGAQVTVSYTKPTSNPLQDPSGNQVAATQWDGIAGRTVVPDCGTWASPFGASSFQAAGSRAAGFQAAGIQASGVQAAGVQAAGFQTAGIQAAAIQTAGAYRRAAARLCLPKATNVEVSSEPVGDDTYAQGETIGVRLTFSEAVTVTGTPRVKLDFSSSDGDEQWAEYTGGSGTTRLEFAYAVAQDDSSSAGVAVLANTLALNGGTIESTSDAGEDATLAHGGLAHNRNHKVDGGRLPTASGAGGQGGSRPLTARFVDVPASHGGRDSAFSFGLEFSEALVREFSSATLRTEALEATNATVTRTKRVVKGENRRWTVTVQPTSGAEVTVSLPATTDCTATGALCTPDGRGLSNAVTATVTAPPPPSVTGVSVVSGTGADQTYGLGDTIQVRVTFDGPVDVTGTPRLKIDMDPAEWGEKWAAYASGGGTDSLTFVHTVVEPNISTQGIAVLEDTLELAGGTIGADGADANLAHDGLGHDANHKVDWRTAGGQPPLTARFVDVPASHEGRDSAFSFGLEFSEALVRKFSSATLRTEALQATNATVTRTKRVVKGDNRRWTVTVQPTSGAEVTVSLPATTDCTATGALCTPDGRRLSSAVSATVKAPAPPSVSGVSVVSSPASGDTYLLGETIRIRATFSEAVTVTGTPTLSIDMDPAEWGEKQAAYASGSGTSSLIFAHTVVEPNLSRQGIAVLADTLTLSGGTIRTAGGTDAALGHTGLGHASGHKVDWRPALSVADARAREGEDEAVEFEVSLSRAFTGAGHSVTVDYATSDGTATAGEDYTAASGTLTFAAGETTKTVSVPVLDDSHDEGHETFSLRLSNLVGARAGDLEATGTIENTDPMPRAWLARFGRTLAEQVVDAVGARLAARGGGGAQARLAGQELAAGGLDADESARLADAELARWLAGRPEQPRTMSGGELLAGSAFSVTSAAAEDRPAAALWGRGGWSRFEGREGSLSVEGEVTTALLGAEVDSRAWLGGVMLSHARGDGSYRADAGAGTVASTLTAVHPYVGVDLSERLTAWAAGGLGLGGLTLTPDGAAALETDLSLVLAALGARGRLVEPTAGSGFSLAIETDAYWVRTGSAEASGLAEAQADATRIRLGLDGGYRIGLAGGGALEPTVAVGVRHDGGDAETGYGMDVGGGLAWSAPALGLSAQVAARGLLTAEFDGFRDLGLSGSLAWDSDPASDRGASLTLTQTVGGAATGGSRALLGRPTLAGLAATGDGVDSRRLELKFGYGFPAFGERLTATPEVGVALSDTARELRLGWKLGLARSGTSSFDLGVEAIRTEPVNDSGPEHGIRLKLDARY